MNTDDQRIREFAYQIWESEGRPDGQEARHWAMACKLAEAQALVPTPPPRAQGTGQAGHTGAKDPGSEKAARAAQTFRRVKRPPARGDCHARERPPA